MPLFGSSGIRTIADRNLFELAFKVGLATGKLYPDVVIGHDPRTSSEALKHAVMSGVLAAGADVADAGMIPTPTLAFIAREHRAGIMITASHNPPEYNGIKLWNPDGSAFDLDQQKQIEDMIAENTMVAAPWSDMKQPSARGDALKKHSHRILQDFPDKLKAKVVVDCGGGAASVITPYLLGEMGCEVISLNSHPTGFFPRGIEPVAANLGQLMEATLRFKADLGIAHDGDADRMMAVDEKGRFITGDRLLVLLARHENAHAVVTTVDASMAIEEAGYKVTRTKVGDSFVSEMLKRRGGDFGGESSGAWIFPKISLCPDGIYAAARIAAAASREKLSAQVDSVQSYPLMRGSIASDGMKSSDLETALSSLKAVSVNRADGLRLEFGDAWLLVRPSGTEPKIRLTAEARTESRARELFETALSLIKSSKKGV